MNFHPQSKILQILRPCSLGIGTVLIQWRYRSVPLCGSLFTRDRISFVPVWASVHTRTRIRSVPEYFPPFDILKFSPHSLETTTSFRKLFHHTLLRPGLTHSPRILPCLFFRDNCLLDRTRSSIHLRLL